MVTLILLIHSCRSRPQTTLTHHWEHVENVLSNGNLLRAFCLIAQVSPHWSVVLGNHEVLHCITTGRQLCSTMDDNESKRGRHQTWSRQWMHQKRIWAVEFQKEDKLGTNMTTLLCRPGWEDGGW